MVRPIYHTIQILVFDSVFKSVHEQAFDGLCLFQILIDIGRNELHKWVLIFENGTIHMYSDGDG